MRRVRLVVALSAVLGGCSCVTPPVHLEDGGEPLTPECEKEGDCPLGNTCVAGRCVAPTDTDAGSSCVEDTDCPPGLRCLRSAGVCIAVEADGGHAEEDAGALGDCFEGQTRSCGVSKLGQCRLGTEACALVAGVFSWGPCQGAVNPVDEVCNGLDDDCDGEVDDGFPTATCGVGECARTVETCVGGVPVSCSPGAPSAEVCDGRDNDCNGLVDDAIAPLVCGVGGCRVVSPACGDGGVPLSCTPGVPTVEVCNGVDDDCDGTVDNDIFPTTVSCGQGLCARTVPACVDGGAPTCVPGMGMAEACNGLDDNCDGRIDEGCACTDGATQPCYTGPAGTRDVGQCRAGTQTCAGGQWGTCQGQVLPAAEVCDGLDNNCNGPVDDLPALTCGIGACRRTAPACAGGAPNTCTPGLPGTETCNGEDDDCDGAVDNGLPDVSCGVGACTRSAPACTAGAPSTCTPGAPQTELCNGIDDNCNGQIDESFPGQGASCNTGQLGRCAAGTLVCVSGGTSCARTHEPSAEICGNGVDENCNGIVDDPMSCGCDPMIDRDFDGANECTDCNDLDATIRPGAPETCNGKDDNCNLLIDEGFDQDGDGFTPCGTRPGGGLDLLRRDCNDNNAYVFPGKTFDCGNAATPASPNNVDDNCNGYTDETCNCSNADRDGDGFSECTGDCDDRDAARRPGLPEVCDGKDNDCNAATVDNCGVSQPCGERRQGSWQAFLPGTDQCKPDLVCASDATTGEMRCGSYCNQTTGIGLNDSCAANEGCTSTLINTDKLQLCVAAPAGTKTVGQSCTAHSECRSTWCSTETPRVCTDSCSNASPCVGGTTCTVVRRSFTAGPPPTTIRYFSANCRLTSLISGTKTYGQTCTGSECRSGPEMCHNGVCREPCCQHADCPAGSSCSIEGPRVATGYSIAGATAVSIAPACLPTVGMRVSGAACATNAECRSGICDRLRGVCADLCCNDTSCPQGTDCEPVRLRLSNGQMTSVRACLLAPYPTQIEQR
jgi:hypothetical protein